jgi:two-component system NtrC family response regulator
LIIQALKLSNGNRTRAARFLGISRPTLIYRLEKYGIEL